MHVGSQHPSFLGIGAQKAGTTWLYQNLKAHPGVALPPEKELHFFDEKRAARGSVLGRILGKTTEAARWRRQFRRHARRVARTASLADVGWLGRYFFGAWDDAWYGSLFAPASDRTTGEVTPSYAVLDSEQVARARQLIPDARIVFLMRNPIERAWSHAMMEVRNRSGSGSRRPSVPASLRERGVPAEDRLRADP